MNILTFDTATEACSVALQCGDTVYFRHEIAPQQHAKLLLPMIQSLILEAKMKLSDLTVIGFGCGPGSFMGVRLATAMAQGLGFGLQISLIPISTLQVLAQTAYQKTQKEKILAGWDARMHEIYWSVFHCDAQHIMQPVTEDRLTAPALVDTSFLDKIALLAGNAWQSYSTQLPDVFLAMQKITNIYPEATAMLTIVISKYLSGDTIAADHAHPHYIRHSVVKNHK